MSAAIDYAALAAQAAINAATPQDAKRPLYRDIAEARPFPVAALGKLQGPAEAIQLITQAPIAICAQSVLATATLAIQAHHDVEGAKLGRRPINGFFCSVAESRERKSAVDRIAMQPLKAVEKLFRENFVLESQTYKNEHEIYLESRSVGKRKAAGQGAEIRQAFNDIGNEPKPPRPPMIVVDDATPEAIMLHLQNVRPWGGQYTAEAGGVVGGHGMRDEKRMSTGAFYNALWDGEPLRRSRAQAGNAYVPTSRFSMHLMMQPDIASALLGDPLLAGMGTIARMLFVAPEPTAGTRLYMEPPAIAWAIVEEYDAAIQAWLLRTPRTESDGEILDPLPLPLTPDARALWIDFYNAVEIDLGPKGDFATIKVWGSKMPEHALRLAAVLAAYDDPNITDISGDAMGRGITLAKHYASEMLRLTGGAIIPPDLRIAFRLLDWWNRRTDARCHLAEIYQFGPNEISDAATARRIAAVLEEHGHIKRLPVTTLLDGKVRKESWELVK